jgi:1,4-dihydroxy-2-naphthoate octaprenyltransferase
MTLDCNQDIKPFILVTLGLVLAHATNNILNDVIDWVKGVDQGNYFRIQYGGHIMELMNHKETALYPGVFFFLFFYFIILTKQFVKCYKLTHNNKKSSVLV